MSIAITLLVLAYIVYGAYSGARRGFVLIMLEIMSFAVATVAALLLYMPVGAGIATLTGSVAALANVAGFVLVWAATEVACAAAIRFGVLPHLRHGIHHSPANRIAGSVANAFKSLGIATLVLLVLSIIPLSPNTKRQISSGYVPGALLELARLLPANGFGALSHDLASSMNFFTVSAEPESEQKIDLGFTASGTVAAELEAQMLELTNHERTSRGLGALGVNEGARAVARAYSIDMLARGYFSHVNPEGKNPFDRMSAAGVKYGNAGENLALAPTLKQAHDGLMKSPGHKANILSPKFKRVGIGIIDAGEYGLMVTQDFTD